MSHPGRVVEVSAPESAPAPLHGAVASLCLTLVDLDTPVWLDGIAGTAETREYLQFHCGCRFVEAPGAARFALIGDPTVIPALSRFDTGTDESPERAACGRPSGLASANKPRSSREASKCSSQRGSTSPPYQATPPCRTDRCTS